MSRRVTVWPWVEGSDLTHADQGSARAAGELAARLHRSSPPVSLDLPERGWHDLVAAARRSVALLEAVAPGEAHAARLALAGLPEEAAERGLSWTAGATGSGVGQRALLHGDLSLDQFLLGDDDVVRLTDLDRVCLGPVELDLASLRAAQLVHEVQRRRGGPEAADGDTESQADDTRAHGAAAWGAFADGYGRAALSGAWVSAALLARVAEPWRSQTPGWREQTQELGQLALDHLTGTLLPGGRWVTAGHADAADLGQPVPGGRSDPASLPGAAVSPVAGRASRDPAGATTSRSVWRVPREVHGQAQQDGADGGPVTVTVGRAWPAGVHDGQARVAIEGLDERGRLRAGFLTPAGGLTLLPHGADPRLPELTTEARAGSLLVHRAGRRAVVHRADGYVKVVRPGRSTGLVESSVQGAAVARAAGFGAADVLGCTDGAVLTATLHGIPVQRLASDASWSGTWTAWAAGWARWQQLPSAGLAAHTPADEATVLRTWAQRVGALDLLVGTAWVQRLGRTARELDRSPSVDLVPTHRDLHDGQLLWDGERVGVVDLDTVCRAEPALDLANLAVHADLRSAQGLWPRVAVERVEEAVDEVARAAGVPAARWELARRATVARLAAVYSLRPRWRDVVLGWAEHQWDAATRWSV